MTSVNTIARDFVKRVCKTITMANFIEFKKIPKSLISEGITIDLLHQLQMHGKLSPVQLMPKEESVKTVPTQRGAFFFIVLADGSTLKNKGVFIKKSRKEIIIARARYLLHNLDAEIESKIDKELESIKKDLDKTVTKIRENFGAVCMYADWEKEETEDYSLLGRNILTKALIMQISPGQTPPQVGLAKEFFRKNSRDEYKKEIDRLTDLQKSGDYETLYHLLKNNGLPLIASFSHDNIAEMELLKKHFHRNTIDKTMDSIQKDSLHFIARMRIEKQYAVLNTNYL